MSFINVFLSDEVIYALGWTVVHALWQGTLVACLMSLLLWGLPVKKAYQRYWVACGALVAVFLGALATFLWVLPSTTISEPTGAWVRVYYADSDLDVAGNPDTWYGYWRTIRQFFDAHLQLIVWMWLAGVGLFSARLAGGLVYVAQLKQSALPLSAVWQLKINVFKHKLGIKTAVWVAESAQVTAPLVVGWLKPLVLLPIGLVNQLSVAQVEAILAHELAHVAGRDYLVNILQSVVELLFYYHPAVWWISATIRAERENRCDDTAIALSGNALVYAKALLSVQEGQHKMLKSAGLALSATGAKPGSLLKRVKRILNQSHNKSSIMEKLTATGLLLVVVSALSFNNYNRAATPTPSVSISEMGVSAFATDSLPKKRVIIREENDGKSVEMQMENGQLKKLSIDGKDVPESDFAKYENMVKSLSAAVPPPPPPPAPGTPPPPPPPPGFKTYTINIDDVRDSNRVMMKKSIIIDGQVISEDWKGLESLDKMTIHGDSLIHRVKSVDIRGTEDGQKIFIWTDGQVFKTEGMPLFQEGQFQALEAEKLQKQAEIMRKQADDMRKQAEKMREQAHQQAEKRREGQRFEFHTDAANNEDAVVAGLRQELAKDGLIKGRGRNTKFSLTDDGLFLNGAQQSKALYEKYVELYKSLSKEKLKKQFNITIYF